MNQGARIGEQDLLLHRAVAYTADPSLLALLVNSGALLEERADDLTPLMMAAQDGKAPMVRALLRLGGNKEAMNRKGQSALDLAKERAGNQEVIRILTSSQ